MSFWDETTILVNLYIVSVPGVILGLDTDLRYARCQSQLLGLITPIHVR
jgi:hypothetical protein